MSSESLTVPFFVSLCPGEGKTIVFVFLVLSGQGQGEGGGGCVQHFQTLRVTFRIFVARRSQAGLFSRAVPFSSDGRFLINLAPHYATTVKY